MKARSEANSHAAGWWYLDTVNRFTESVLKSITKDNMSDTEKKYLIELLIQLQAGARQWNNVGCMKDTLLIVEAIIGVEHKILKGTWHMLEQLRDETKFLIRNKCDTESREVSWRLRTHKLEE